MTTRQIRLFYEEAERRELRMKADQAEAMAAAFGEKDLAGWIRRLREV